MAHELTIICPSKGRPKSAVKVYESFRENCTADTKLIIAVSEDDPYLTTYWSLLNGVGQVTVVPAGRRGMCDALNAAFDLHESSLGFAVGFIGDDMRLRTKGGDAQLLEELHMGSLFAYGNDLLQGELMATEWIQQTRSASALGFMVPPGFQHLCVDLVVRDWGLALDSISYRDDVVIQHLHPLAGTGKMDANYAAVNSTAVANHDSAEYRRYKESGEFDADVAKLAKLLDEGR